jgi:hypothetical protein
MDPYDEERLAKQVALAAAEVREAMEEGVKRGWFYAWSEANGGLAYGLTEEGKKAMERGELG